MKGKMKSTGKASSVPAGLTYGALTETALTLSGAAVTACLIEKEIISWNNMGYAVIVILLLSAWSGAMVTAGCVKRQRMIMCLASGAVYLCILLISTALFFGGQYSGVGETALLIFCGSILAMISEARKGNRKTIHGVYC